MEIRRITTDHPGVDLLRLRLAGGGDSLEEFDAPDHCRGCYPRIRSGVVLGTVALDDCLESEKAGPDGEGALEGPARSARYGVTHEALVDLRQSPRVGRRPGGDVAHYHCGVFYF